MPVNKIIQTLILYIKNYARVIVKGTEKQKGILVPRVRMRLELLTTTGWESLDVPDETAEDLQLCLEQAIQDKLRAEV